MGHDHRARWLGLIGLAPVLGALLVLGEPARAQTSLTDPLPAPLSRADPRARLDPAFQGVPPLPVPQSADLPRPYGARPDIREVTYDALTGRATVSALPAEARLSARGSPGWSVAAGDPGYPGPSSVRIRNIFGDDDRERRSTTDYPWRTQCKLFLKFPDRKWFHASGTLIGPNDVLTAGHCIYDADHGGWAAEVEVVPGLDGTYQPYGSAKMRSAQTSNEWVDRTDWDYDVALITLDRNIGKSTGWLSYGFFASVIGVTAHLAAYPLDKEDGALYYSSGLVEDATAHRLYYRFDTTEGESGGGVYRLFEDDQWIFAVHSGYSSSVDMNRATWIDAATYETIRAWKYGND